MSKLALSPPLSRKREREQTAAEARGMANIISAMR
jgi:hypothetical protein